MIRTLLAAIIIGTSTLSMKAAQKAVVPPSNPQYHRLHKSNAYIYYIESGILGKKNITTNAGT